jgi:ribosome modulation factor
MLDSEQARRLTLRLTEPYIIPEDCPYLSEDQRELSKLTFEQRAQWMAEWLALAQDTVDD